MIQTNTLYHPQHRFFLRNFRNLKHYNVKIRQPQSVSAVAVPPQSRPSITHSMPPEKEELFKSLYGWAEETIIPFLKPVEQSWQPHDFLPDSSLSSDLFIEQARELRTENNPYLGFVYAAFQERATFIAHGNTARLVKKHGDSVLARICGTIAADEKRHEKAYECIIEKLLELDTSDAVVGIANMMRKKVTMPGRHLMYDGQDPNLFDHFSAVAQRIGVYTVSDYADILDFLVGRWKLEKLEGLNSEARQSQDFICGLPAKIRKLHEMAQQRSHKMKPKAVRFSWIFNKELTF